VIPGGAPAPAVPEAEPSIVVDSLVAAPPSIHVIARGESLASIARQYGITVEQLIQINNITNPNLIYSGQPLMVFTAPDAAAPQAVLIESAPAPQAEAPAVAASTTYVVQPGDHLSQIGRQYGVSWVAIAQANGITNADTIYAGQTLTIPAPGTIPDLGIMAAPAAPAPTIFSGRQIADLCV
jgi:LysM repeat protein